MTVNKQNLQDCIEKFCSERESLRSYMKSNNFLKNPTYDNESLIDYFIDLWIKDVKSCSSFEQLDSIIRSSLRMSFEDWYSSL